MYERVIEACTESPWAILPAKLAVIEAFLSRKASGETLSEEEIEAALPRGRQRPGAPIVPAGVGLIPIHGTITNRANVMSNFSGGTSTELAGQQLNALVNDPNVTAIVLDISSPGGSVYGVEQLALQIQAATKTKPIIAVANALAASAAYWIASAASELVVTPDGEVGSIGVYQMHVDKSARAASDGQKVTYIKAGRLKAVGNPHEPLTDEAKADLQKGVNDYYDMFVTAVARGRKVSEATVRNGFGEGSTVRAKEAVASGMVDRIGTLDSVLGRYGLSTADITGGMNSKASETATESKGESKASETASGSTSRPNAELRRRRLLIDEK
jgi:capsid assembly protease